MKIPYKIHYLDKGVKSIKVGEWAVMPSGKIVVVSNLKNGYQESYWFHSDGTNPKSYLEFIDIKI